MDQVGNHLTDLERISFVTKYLRESAAQWFTIVRDNITTYQQFRDAFENRYWNMHTQRQVRDELEFGRYNPTGGQSMEQYAITQIERCKHLKPKYSEYEIISKLAYHYHKTIQLAMFTQGIQTIEKFLVLITQGQPYSHSGHNTQTTQPRNYGNTEYRDYRTR